MNRQTDVYFETLFWYLFLQVEEESSHKQSSGLYSQYIIAVARRFLEFHFFSMDKKRENQDFF